MIQPPKPLSEGLERGFLPPPVDLVTAAGEILPFDRIHQRGRALGLLFVIAEDLAEPALKTLQGAALVRSGVIDLVTVVVGPPPEGRLEGAHYFDPEAAAAQAFRVGLTPALVRINAHGLISGELARGFPWIEATLSDDVADQAQEAADGSFQALLDAPADLSGFSILVLGDKLLPFTGVDQNGRRFSSDTLTGRETLLLALGRQTGLDRELVSILREWEGGKPAWAPDLVVLTSAPRARARALRIGSPVLWGVSPALLHQIGLDPAPAAVLVSAAGRLLTQQQTSRESIIGLLYGGLIPNHRVRAEPELAEAPAEAPAASSPSLVKQVGLGVARARAHAPILRRGRPTDSAWALKGLAEIGALYGATALERSVAIAWDWLRWPAVVRRANRAVDPSEVRDAAEIAGRTVEQQQSDAVATCLRYGVSPAEYYEFALFDPDRAPFAGGFLSKTAALWIFDRLLSETQREDRLQIVDKAPFADFCARNGLATIPVIGIAQDGRFERGIAEDDPAWRGDLVIKPRFGTNGIGVTIWKALDGGWFEGPGGARLTLDELTREWARFSLLRPMIVQPRVRNHADMSGLTSGALATVRIVTGLIEGQDPVVIAAALKMPCGSMAVDNFGHGGLLSQIDIQTGRLRPGQRHARRLVDIEYHPDTGARFAGLRTPHWREMTALACRTHHLFPKFAVLACDVAVTTEGPVIVEANSRGDLNLVQHRGGVPIADTLFTDVLLSKPYW